MRYWDRVRDPDRNESPQRGGIRRLPAPSQFGQRPLFSRPDEGLEPSESELPTEARLEDLIPADEGPGSASRTQVIGEDASPSVLLAQSRYNVSDPPTEAQIEAAFGPRQPGFTAIILDGTRVWLIIRTKHDNWTYLEMTNAV